MNALLPPAALESDPMAPIVHAAPAAEKRAAELTTDRGDFDTLLPPPAYVTPAAACGEGHRSGDAAARINRGGSGRSAPCAERGQLPNAQTRPAEISAQLASARKAAQALSIRRQKTQQRTVAALLLLILLVATGLGVGYATGLIRIGAASSKVATAESPEDDASRQIAPDNVTGTEQASNTNAGNAKGGGSKAARSKDGVDDGVCAEVSLTPQRPPESDAKASAPPVIRQMFVRQPIKKRRHRSRLRIPFK